MIMTKLTQMNIPQLRKLCRAKGLYGVSKMNKKTLRKILAVAMGDLYEFKEHNDILYIILRDYMPESYWCQLAQVSKTYNKVVREVGFSPWYCICPRCEASIHRGEFNVQKDILWQPVYDINDYSMVLRNSFSKIRNTVEYHNKIVECYDIFCSIARNRWIIEEYPLFRNAVLKKVLDMKNDKNTEIIIDLLGSIFFDLLFSQ